MSDYDLTKTGPVLSLEPVMVMVTDLEFDTWHGPYELVYIDHSDTLFPCYVYDHGTIIQYAFAKLYKKPEKKTRPMTASEIAQLARDGARFYFGGHREGCESWIYNPVINSEGIWTVNTDGTIKSVLFSNLKGYRLGDDEIRPFEIEVVE